MADLLRECLDAGAVGLSTSYVDVEDDMRPVPCRFAEHTELEALCAVLGERGRMLQIVHEFYDAGLTVSRIELLADLSLRYGIPTTLSPLFHTAADARRRGPGHGRRRAGVGRAARGCGRRCRPARSTSAGRWTSAASCSWPSPGGGRSCRCATRRTSWPRSADPATREALVDGMDAVAAIRGGGMDAGDYLVRDVALDRNRDLVGRTLGEIAAERGTTPAELLIDLSVEEELGTWFMRADIGHSDPDAVGALLAHPLVHVGASDGGAHVGSFATYGDTGFLLSRYVRETGAAVARGGGQEDHRRPGDDLGPARPRPARGGLRRRRRGVRRRRRSTAARRSPPTTSPAAAPAGSGGRWASTPSSSTAR